MSVRLEWIGVTTPSNNEVVNFRKLTGQYSDLESKTLEAIAALLRPRIRFDGATRRTLRKETLGLSKGYRFGESTAAYTQTVTDSDAKIILAEPRLEYEFRNLDDPAHDDRVPIVPPEFMTDIVQKILASAKNGQPPTMGSPMVFDNAQGVLKRYETIREAEQ